MRMVTEYVLALDIGGEIGDIGSIDVGIDIWDRRTVGACGI